MTRRSYAGGAASLVLSGNITSSTTSISTTGTATGWPTGSGGKFLAVIDRGLATEEKFLVNSRSGNTLTLASAADRGADGTSAASHTSGATIEHVIGALDIDEPNQHINDTTIDNHTQYLKTDASRAPSAGTGAFYGAPAASAPGDAQTTGTASSVANSAHKHARVAGEPLGFLGYAQVTADQGAITTEADLTSVTVTVTAGTSRRLKITVYCIASADNANAEHQLYIKEGATYLGTSIASSPSAGTYLDHRAMAVVTPGAGSHTYKAAMIRSTGSGNVIMRASSTNPAFILVEDIGNA